MSFLHAAATTPATTSGHGFAILLALVLWPLLGGLIVALVPSSDRSAKFTAFFFSIVEFALAVVALFVHQTGGARLQFAASVNWVPSFGVHLSFGMDGIA